MSVIQRNLSPPTSLSESQPFSLLNLLTVLLILTMAPVIALGQDPMRGWEWQNPKPQGNSINSVRFAGDQLHGWAVGSDGVILRTENGGFEWAAQASPANSTLYGIYVKDRARVVISGARGVVLTTINGGNKWVPRNTGVRDHLFGVTFAPDDLLHGWAVGSFGAIIVTSDGGLTWKTQNSNTTAHLFGVAFANSRTGVAVGARGTLLVTSNGGGGAWLRSILRMNGWVGQLVLMVW